MPEAMQHEVNPFDFIRRNPLGEKPRSELGLEKIMFEAADPAVFEWYIRNYGYKVNLFVDHSQIVQLDTVLSVGLILTIQTLSTAS